MPVPVQVVPQGMESVNGSDANMGCTSPLVDSGGVMVCGSPCDRSTSYLMDGNSPVIDTSASDWASQLVTVRKNDAIPDRIPVDHVVMTFRFDTAVSLTSIELDLFLCPEWNIGAPLISVTGNENGDSVPSSTQSVLAIIYIEPSQSSCDSLLTVCVLLQNATTTTVHIIVEMDYTESDWVHVGEVRFQGTPADPDYTQSMNTHTLLGNRHTFADSHTIKLLCVANRIIL